MRRSRSYMRWDQVESELCIRSCGLYTSGTSRRPCEGGVQLVDIELHGKRTSCVLGRFYTKEDAHRAWQQEKMRLVLMHIDNTNCELTQKGLHRVYTKIKHDFDNNLITEDF